MLISRSEYHVSKHRSCSPDRNDTSQNEKTVLEIQPCLCYDEDCSFIFQRHLNFIKPFFAMAKTSALSNPDHAQQKTCIQTFSTQASKDWLCTTIEVRHTRNKPFASSVQWHTYHRQCLLFLKVAPTYTDRTSQSRNDSLSNDIAPLHRSVPSCEIATAKHHHSSNFVSLYPRLGWVSNRWWIRKTSLLFFQ